MATTADVALARTGIAQYSLFSVDTDILSKGMSMKSDGLGSPERYLSSLDCVIADMRITLKRGIFLRGYYVSANNIKDCERPSYLILPFG